MLATAILALSITAAPATPVPRAAGFVTDSASILSASDRAALEARLAAWRAATGHELAVLTMKDLGGEPIEPFATRVVREWKLGSAERSDGALLVIAMAERAVRIEVLVGLEGDLPDALCGRIIDREIVPRFKSGDFAGGVRAGVEAILAAAGGAPPPSVVEHRAAKRRSSGVLFSFLPILLFVIIAIARSRGRYGAGPFGRRRRFGGLGPWFWGGFGGGFGAGLGGSGRIGGGSSGFGGFGGGGHSFGGGATGRW